MHVLSYVEQAMAAAKSNPNIVPTGLFIQALDTMIDVHEKQLTVDRDYVPAVVFLMLEGLAVLALSFCGYGVAPARMHAILLMALMIGSVITLVVDLDRPQSGFIKVSQQPLLDLIKGMP